MSCSPGCGIDCLARQRGGQPGGAVLEGRDPLSQLRSRIAEIRELAKPDPAQCCGNCYVADMNRLVLRNVHLQPVIHFYEFSRITVGERLVAEFSRPSNGLPPNPNCRVCQALCCRL